ncbi:MAG TPA: acyl-CoA thioesterase [Jatrophihabitans sp.]
MPRFSPDRLDRAAYAEPGVDMLVMYGDLDTLGHVNNVTLQRYFEQVRYTVHRDAGVIDAMQRRGWRFVVARYSVDFIDETFFGSPLHARVRLGRIGNTSFIEEQAAWQDGRCVAISEVVFACQNAEGKGAPVPPDVLEMLRGALGTAAITGA